MRFARFSCGRAMRSTHSLANFFSSHDLALASNSSQRRDWSVLFGVPARSLGRIRRFWAQPKFSRD